MPDVVVVGGGVIGVAVADELSRRGASVALFERDALASAASGRNMGLWLPTEDPATYEMGRRSIEAYLALADDAPAPFRIDRTPFGYLLFAVHDDDVERGRAIAETVAAGGVTVDEVAGDDVTTIDPAYTHGVAAAWRVADGHRLDPGALTVALATRAARNGATIRHHLAVRTLLERHGRVGGVLTDDGAVDADHVVVAAGPWTPVLLEAAGVPPPPITGAIGWVVRVGPAPGLPTTLMESVGWRHQGGGGSAWPTAGDIASHGVGPFQSTPSVHPHDDGSITIGSMRQPWVTPEAPDASVLRTLLADAIAIAPTVAHAPVRSSRWCVRPMTPDERPLIGRVREGLWICGGHGSEGVILGAGSAQLLGAVLDGEEPPYDPAPFDPARF
ncbi:MAG TPA: FAD-binding oxidoreductase [Actinomycetota bacterium]|nr:FAD-binding oxidoreductase [Actinomycetota bacterium]